MAAPGEKWYARYAWIVFFVIGLLYVIASPINLLGTPPNPPSPEGMTGLTLDGMDARIPGMRNYLGSISVQVGNFLLLSGVLTMGIAAFAYRKGERWAWYVLWMIPVFLVIQLLNSRGGFGWQADLVFLVVALAALFLPFRKFFPR